MTAIHTLIAFRLIQICSPQVMHSMHILFLQVMCLKMPDLPPVALIRVHLSENKLGNQIFFLKYFTHLEVFNALSSIDPKRSTGADQLEAKLLLLSLPLSTLILYL